MLCRNNNGLPPDNPEAYRFAVDYRKLNTITKYPRYHLPLIDDLIMNIPHTGIMSALDLRSGYFQMAVNPSDIVKTTFVTKNGTYVFRRMPFGLSGVAPNFQKAIDIILKPVIGKFVNVYMDDIEAQKAFDAVKATKTAAPVLKFLDFKKPFELITDASSIGVGAVLNQEQRPVVFASRTLSAAERNYTVTERECLAVVWTRNKFRTYLGSLPIKVIADHAALTHLTTGKKLSNRMIRWALKLAEFNIEWEHRPGTQNTIADVLSRNPIENIIGEKVNCAIIRDLVLSSRDQLIEEQKRDLELGHIYRYLENPEDNSVNAAICENWSREFKLVEGLLFYAKYATSLGEMRIYVTKSSRNEIMREFHDKPLAGYFGRFKTYHKIRDVCYFPYMRKFINQYVFTCHMCQINNYKHALPAGRLIPIVSNYPNEIVSLDLLGPYPVSRIRRNRYVLIITDHFSKWAEIIPIKKASARDIAHTFFNNYISHFGAPIKLISDNGPQFISNIFENLSEILGIRHVKTVVYRPQANRTERVNRDLVQMIANYVNEQHDRWDQFLREFAYAIRTDVNETMEKTAAELFSGRKLITSFSEISDGIRRNGISNQFRIYRHSKCDETEIGTGSSRITVVYAMNRAVLTEYNGYQMSHEMVKRKGQKLGYKRSNEFTSRGPERKVQKRSEHRGIKRNLSSNDSNSVLPRLRKKNRREETVTPTTSGYNLRPTKRKREESRLTIEMKTQQGGPVRFRKGRERNDSPYIKERTRSSNKNARRGGDQQRQNQERRGTCTKKSLSLEVLVGIANYKL
ncbi:transposon Tf2-8 polyprotein [Trichonephila clavipes]|nr:transposon Tf2-8 polyprotein [Trichonephila clavipes]